MFGKRCTLCGGRLNADEICTECGLNNTKYQSKYILNRGSCDSKPLTHVHEEKKQKKSQTENKYQYNTLTKKQNNGNRMGCLMKIIKWGIILFIIFQFIGILLGTGMF